MEPIVDYICSQLKELTAIPSPSGFTKQAAAYVCATLEGMGYEPQLSRKGNVLVELGGQGSPLVLAAHVDTLGAMVRSVKTTGRLRPTTLGGHQWSTADGENCTIHTRDGRAYSGTVQSNYASQHVFAGMGAKPRDDKNMEIVIDEIVRSADDVKKLGIAPGCFVSWDTRTVLTESGYLKSRHLDDKASSGICWRSIWAASATTWAATRPWCPSAARIPAAPTIMR